MTPNPDPVCITPLANGGVRSGIADMLLGVALGVGIALAFTGCTTSAFIVASSASGSGYDPGIGLRVETMGDHGPIRPRLDARVSYEPKRGADTGYTYAGYAGLQGVWRGTFVEAGGIGYGYESRFADGTIWRKSYSDWYARAGYAGRSVLAALTYVPPSPDSYASDSLAFELRWTGSDWTAFVKPSSSRFEFGGESDQTTSIAAGIGYRW